MVDVQSGEICSASDSEDSVLGEIDVVVEIPSTKPTKDLQSADGDTAQERSSVPVEEGGLLDELTAVPLQLKGRLKKIVRSFEKLEGVVPDVVGSVVASFQVKNKRDIAGIIGTGGSNVSRLEQATRCHISTPPKHDPSRVVTVQGGTGKQVFSCLEMLSQELSRAIDPYHSIQQLATAVYPFFNEVGADQPSPILSGECSAPPSPMGGGVGSPPITSETQPVPLPPGMYHPQMTPQMVHEPQMFPPHPMGYDPYAFAPSQHVAYPMAMGYGYAMMPQPGMPYPMPHHHHHPHPMASGMMYHHHQSHVAMPVMHAQPYSPQIDGSGSNREPVTIQVPFPPDKAGLIFGRGGRTLAQLKRETGARFQVAAEAGVVTITAPSSRHAQRARTAIMSIMASAESRRLIFMSVGDRDELVCFVPFHDPSLLDPSSTSSRPRFILSDQVYGSDPSIPNILNREASPVSSGASTPARTECPTSPQRTSRTHSVSSDSDPGLFADLDLNRVRGYMHDCLERLRPTSGQVEVLCRFGKMVFRSIPDLLVGAPFPRSALAHIVRQYQIMYTYECGAGFAASALESAVNKIETSHPSSSTTRHVFYLSIVPDSAHPATSVLARRRLDVMLERIDEGDTRTLRCIGVREPYLKPFKVDILSPRLQDVDTRLAVRASPSPLSPTALALVQEFAATIKPVGDLELEYPSTSPFRVTGCALKQVRRVVCPARQLALEVIQHVGQPSQRQYEFAATLSPLEDLLGSGGAGVNGGGANPSSWQGSDVVELVEPLMSAMHTLAQDIAIAEV